MVPATTGSDDAAATQVKAPAIEVGALTKRYGTIAAVDGLSFSVSRGTVAGFLGPNGAGKTTTMRVLLGLAAPTSGESRVLGVPYAHLSDPLRRVGAVLEITGFHPGRTGRNHLRVMAREGGISEERIDITLAQVGMTEAAGRRVGQYSLGMKQRLGLASAMLGDPEILILDEPANGLDPAGVAWLRAFLRAFADAGRTVFVSSHVLGEISQIADRLVVIDKGKLVAEGPVAQITGTSGGTVVVRSPGAERLRTALEMAGASVETDAEGALHVSGMLADRVGEIAAAERLVLHELRTQQATLEEAFLKLTSGGGL